MTVGRGRHLALSRSSNDPGPVVVRVALGPAGAAVTSRDVPSAGGFPVWEAPLAAVDVDDACLQVRWQTGFTNPNASLLTSV